MARRVTQVGDERNKIPQSLYESAAPILDPISKASLGLFGAMPLAYGLAEGIRSGISEEGFKAGFPRGAGAAGAAAVDPFVRTGEDAARFFGGRDARAPWEAQFTGGASAAERGGYLQKLLGENTPYDRAADIEAAANDPRLMAELNAYNELMARLRPEVEQAKSAVSGAYGTAAGAGRTAAGNIGTRGERTAATYEDLYGRAATEAGNLSQAGGTAVSGLTGPGQAFQDIYGGAYGLGGTEAYGTRGTADIAAEGMQARAGQAAGAGSRAASNIENYWSKMTLREQGAFGAALRAKGYAKEDELKLKDQQLLQFSGTYVGMYEADKDQRKRLKGFFGPTVNDTNYNTEIPRIMKQLADLNGPTALLDTLIASGMTGGVTGG